MALSVPVPAVAEYNVGWICAIEVEYVIACELLDHEYPRPPSLSQDDRTTYTFGRIGQHNVVVACLPFGKYGLTSAASVAQDMLRSFKSLHFRLMVGIGGGAPSRKHDIRLGDVVVGKRVIHYEYGKTLQNKRFQHMGILGDPPVEVLSAVGQLSAQHKRRGHEIDKTVELLLKKMRPKLRREYQRPSPETDVLYASSFVHADDEKTCQDTCLRSTNEVIHRPQHDRGQEEVIVHYGLIASADRLMKDANARDRLADTEGALCFEMEAAGLMDRFDPLVIRGICDYSDTHKNDIWQGYAAVAAAAYAKELLSIVNSPSHINKSFVTRSEEPSTLATSSTSVLSDFAKSIPDYTQEELDCLRSLWFKDMEARRHDIDLAEHGTCLWLSDHPTYKKWAEQGNGLLWISGKPGAGKSVLLDTILRNKEDCKTENDFLVASFFIHGRGSPIQKSPIGLYRSLLHQILTQARPLLAELCRMFTKNQKERGPVGQLWDWHEKQLVAFMDTHVRKYATTHRVGLFVDALDECDEAVARRLASDLWRLTSPTTGTASSLSVCFTCRHFPIMDLHGGLEICVEHENANDIVTYVRRHLEGFEDPQQRTILEQDILRKSSGLFLWVVLTLPGVAQLGREGYPFDTVRGAIQNIPESLSLIYEETLSKMQSPYGIHSLRLFQWICLAVKPVTLSILRYALSFNTECPQKSIAIWTASDSFLRSNEQMAKWIRTLSGGLIETVGQSDSVVQFIHQSVKDYFMSAGLLKLEQSVLGVVHSRTISVAWGHGHDHLSSCCLHYLLTSEVFYPTKERPLSLEEYSMVEHAYSWHLYAKQAEDLGVSQASLLAVFHGRSDRSFQHFVSLCRDQYRGKLRMINEGSQVLHLAASHGLSTLIETILTDRCSTNPNIKDSKGDTPLIQAARAGHKRAAEKLLELGAHHNYRGDSSKTPLLCASEHGHEQVVALLIESGADINLTDLAGRTPLICASSAGYTAITEMLLSNGADPEIEDVSGRSALSWACSRDHPSIVKVLLQSKVGRPMYSDGSYLLELAIIENSLRVAQFLLESTATSARPEYLSMGLLNAVTIGDLELVRLFVEKGGDLNWKGMLGLDPLQEAINCADTAAAEWMIEHGARIELHHGGLMFLAARAGHVALASKFLEIFTPNIHNARGDGRTPLFEAVRYNRKMMVEFLLQKGADPDPSNNLRFTPLILAASLGHTIIGEMLLSRGVNVNAADQISRTALHRAVENGHIGMVGVLLERGADKEQRDSNGSTSLCHAVRNNSIECTQLLLRHGSDPCCRDAEQRTLLWIASELGEEAMVGLLLDYPHDSCDTPDSGGRTALWWAVRRGNAGILKLLLEKGHANPNIPTHTGEYPISQAVKKGDIAATQLLLKHNATLDLSTNLQLVSLSLATRNRDQAMIKLLLEYDARNKVA